MTTAPHTNDVPPSAHDGLARFRVLVQDIFATPRNQRLAAQVRVLSALTSDRHGTLPDGASWPISQQLEVAADALQQVLETARAAADGLDLHWGARPAAGVSPGPAPVPAPVPRTAVAAAAADSPPGADAAAEVQAPQRRGAAWPGLAETIELADWLERSAEDDRLPPARALAVARDKMSALLQSLEITRIQRTGAFDAGEQQIVETVVTRDASLDMTVCESVQCGYRQGPQLLRPERVLVYRCAGAAQEGPAHV